MYITTNPQAAKLFSVENKEKRYAERALCVGTGGRGDVEILSGGQVSGAWCLSGSGISILPQDEDKHQAPICRHVHPLSLHTPTIRAKNGAPSPIPLDNPCYTTVMSV